MKQVLEPASLSLFPLSKKKPCSLVKHRMSYRWHYFAFFPLCPGSHRRLTQRWHLLVLYLLDSVTFIIQPHSFLRLSVIS